MIDLKAIIDAGDSRYLCLDALYNAAMTLMERCDAIEREYLSLVAEGADMKAQDLMNVRRVRSCARDYISAVERMGYNPTPEAGVE